MQPVRVLVVESAPPSMGAPSRDFDDADGVDVVAATGDGAEALVLQMTLHPDVVVMDVPSPPAADLDLIHRMTGGSTPSRVLAVAGSGSLDLALAVLRAGASGCLLEVMGRESLAAAIRQTHAGASVLSPQVTRRLVTVSPASADPPTRPLLDRESLSPREHDIVAMLAEGRSNAEIARDLHLSEATVKSHLGRVMVKWGVRDRVQVLIRAARARVVRVG